VLLLMADIVPSLIKLFELTFNALVSIFIFPETVLLELLPDITNVAPLIADILPLLVRSNVVIDRPVRFAEMLPKLITGKLEPILPPPLILMFAPIVKSIPLLFHRNWPLSVVPANKTEPVPSNDCDEESINCK